MIPLTISVDDVNPKPGYRIIGEKSEKWLRSLHDDFGCKFTLFVPSCYHGEYPLSEHKGWVQELASIDWCEIAAHGHLHMTSDSRRFGECEFLEVDSSQLATERIDALVGEWNACGVDPRQLGWRNPGWLCTEVSKKEIEATFKYAAIHYEHNRGMKWNIPTFFGHDGIQQSNIELHNTFGRNTPSGAIMFTSHIAGNHNHNVWNEDNYNQLRGSIEFLLQNEQITFNTLNELC